MARSREALSAAQRGKIRRIAGPNAPDEGQEGELNVVPFLDILMNVMMFVLATLAVTFTATVDIAPPRPKPPGPGAAPSSLALHVVVVQGGFLVSAMGKHIAAGCDGEGAGLTVGHDFSALTDCVKRLKATFPEFERERDVTISANPDIPYQTVIATVDAVRRTGDTELFPQVSFALPR